VLIPGNDFWSHVARSSRGVLLVVGRVYPGDAHVGQPEIAFRIEDQILRFDVSVEDTVIMQVLQAEGDAADEKFYNVLWEFLNSTNLKAKVASWHVIHDQIEIHSILESIDHVNYEGVL
jgi:hypothetical protein